MTTNAQVNAPCASNVIDRIVDQNNALWSLLTDHTLTREQQLECIERAFPSRAAESPE